MIGKNSIMKSSILTFFAIDWPHTLKRQDSNNDTSFQNLFDSMIKNKHKFKTKPWITTAPQKSSSIKKKIFKDYINKKDLTKKTELHNKYKSCRNIFSTLMKKSKIISPSFLKTT